MVTHMDFYACGKTVFFIVTEVGTSALGWRRGTVRRE